MLLGLSYLICLLDNIWEVSYILIETIVIKGVKIDSPVSPLKGLMTNPDPKLGFWWS